MSAKVNARPGAALHFVVEHREGTIWKEHAVVPAKVKNGVATATFKAQHKPQPDKAHLPTALRFRLEERAPAGKR